MKTEQIIIKQSNGEKRVIGIIKDRVFIKEVWESKHLMRKLDAWGIDSEMFNKNIKHSADMIVVFDKQRGIFYETTTEKFAEKGSYLHFKPHRAQIFLPREMWSNHK